MFHHDFLSYDPTPCSYQWHLDERREARLDMVKELTKRYAHAGATVTHNHQPRS